jgi:hypothetical protein
MMYLSAGHEGTVTSVGRVHVVPDIGVANERENPEHLGHPEPETRNQEEEGP